MQRIATWIARKKHVLQVTTFFHSGLKNEGTPEEVRGRGGLHPVANNFRAIPVELGEILGDP